MIFISILTCPALAMAQYNWDAGVSLGASNYLGDMGGDELTRRDFVSDMKLSETKFAGGLWARYKINPQFSVKAGFNYLRISGADSLSQNYGRYGRNLSFRNDIFELTTEAQYFFYEINDLGRTYRYRNDFRAFVGIGFSGFMHNPMTLYQDQWVALRPLQTEGVSYGKFSFAVPATIGFYFTLDKRYRIGWNLSWRTAFTDYLDDVSTVYADPNTLDPTAAELANRSDENPVVFSDPVYLAQYTPGNKRGDPSHNDSYISTTIDFSYVLRGKSSFYRSKYGSLFKGKKYKKRKFRAKF